MQVLDKQFISTVRRLYADLDTPRSLACEILLRYGEWDQLVTLKIDPTHYTDNPSGAFKFRKDYQATHLLRKCDGLPTSFDRRQAAENGFWECEKVCYHSNERMRHLLENLAECPELPGFAYDVIRSTRKIIRKVLGHMPLELDGGFGKGTVVEAKGELAKGKKLTLGDKLTFTPSVTQGAIAYAPLAERTAWLRNRAAEFPYKSSYSVVAGNRFGTVPKDSTKFRGICIEPGMNVWLQLGVGRHIRRRLRDIVGINLDSGQELHKSLAQRASRSGTYSTIDLSNASDTICKNLVELLLPKDWFDLLDDLRSKRTWFKAKGDKTGKWVYLEKFSSMGNGFTFELETLIFYALCSAVTAVPEIHVYGDDIIVPSEHSDAVLAALKFFGFTPNPRKTFVSGVFRESCGGDYFNGQCCTPLYIKEIPHEPAQWITLANGLWRASFNGALPQYRRARNTALSCLPSDIRLCTGPEQLGDLVVHADPQDWRNTTVRHGIRYFRVWRPVSRRVRVTVFKPTVQLALALYGAPSTGLVPRDAISGYRFGRVAYS